MKKQLQTIAISIVALVGFAALPVAPVSAQTVNCSGKAVDCATKGFEGVGGSQNNSDLTENLKTVTNILLFILGAIGVIMIIIGGIRYATSNGDASHTKAAKDTILYAVIGLVVAVLAYAIVRFILDAFK